MRERASDVRAGWSGNKYGGYIRTGTVAAQRVNSCTRALCFTSPKKLEKHAAGVNGNRHETPDMASTRQSERRAVTRHRGHQLSD